MEVLDICVDLMVDPFGNYLCQKLVEVCPPVKLGVIIDKVLAEPPDNAPLALPKTPSSTPHSR